MSEKLQTRTEHSRSIEDAEKFKALETLKKLGLLIPVSDLETFHGRVNTDGEQWTIDPTFANGSNDSGNRNVYGRPGLYTGPEVDALDFSSERARGMVLPIFDELIKDRVRSYTAEERQEWLEREIKSQKDFASRIDPAQRHRYKLEPITLENLDEKLWSEVRRVQDVMPEEEKQALWEVAHQNHQREIHQIVSADTDAMILDGSFDEAYLEDDELEEYHRALKALIIPITEGSPVNFAERDKIESVALAINESKKKLIEIDDIDEIMHAAGVSDETAIQMCGAYNSLQIARLRLNYLARILTQYPEGTVYTDGLPINLEYVERLFRQSHIVGIRGRLNSATLGRQIDAVTFFDLEKTATTETLDAERQQTWEKFGEIAAGLGKVARAERRPDHTVLELLEDAHAKPHNLVEAAKKVDGYEAIFDGDTGNWEGFTLAEHTETVLRNFDETYADRLPVELLSPMRLAILAHDIGKPVAVRSGEAHKQKLYNIVQAEDFLAKLGVNEKLKDLLIAVIGDGSDLAFQIEVRGGGEPAKQAMDELAVNALSRFYEFQDVTEDQKSGFIEMCMMLQACDGGAYTSIAVTRKGKGKGRHRNAPSFESSFEPAVGFGRATRLKKKPTNKRVSV